jgi:hypothetical protein
MIACQWRRAVGATCFLLIAASHASAQSSPPAVLGTGPEDAASSPSDGRQGVVAGNVVALFQLGAPEDEEFILRGTVPLPRGVFPRADGQMPLAIVDADSRLVDTQIEIVSRYPGVNAWADVVEVIAQVHRPPQFQVGDPLYYSLIEHVHPPRPPAIPDAVQSLMRSGISLRARDVFGHLYAVSLTEGSGDRRTLKQGAALHEIRTYGSMLPTGAPIGPPFGALSHLFGAHAYITQRSGEAFVTLDLRVNNGPSGADLGTPVDDPQARIYFQSLELVVPQGWQVIQEFADPMVGTPYAEGSLNVFPMVAPLASGKMHVMPVQGQMIRRFVITKNSSNRDARSCLKDEGLGFCRQGTNSERRELWSWWNPRTARYFPQRHLIPNLDHIPNMLAKLDWEYRRTLEVLTSGQGTGIYPFHSDRLGWAHPWGVQYGGMASGSEVFLYDGLDTAASASRQGYQLYQLTHRMYTDRHPVSLYDRDGQPTRFERWLSTPVSGEPYVNSSFYMRPLGNLDPFGFNEAPTWQVDFVQANGLAPGYEPALLAHEPIDLQHLVRYTRSPKVLVWLGNDSMAKDDLRLHGELVRLSYHPFLNSPGGYVIPSGMRFDMDRVAAMPGVGFSFGRGEGWGIDTMSAVYSINQSPWREATRPWFTQIVQLLEAGQSNCTGIIQAQTSGHWFGGAYRARQSIEQAIVENALWSMRESVFGESMPDWRQRTDAVLVASLRSMINHPAWDPTFPGPSGVLAVGPANSNQPPFCNNPPSDGRLMGVDRYQTWSSFAYGYELTGDPIFIQRAEEMSNWSNGLLHYFRYYYYDNLANKCALFALLQQ